MALLTVGPTFDQAKSKINKILLQILGIPNSEIWLFDDVNKIDMGNVCKIWAKCMTHCFTKL